MDHPLAMDAEAMRRAGYATVDALVARLADPEGDPVLRRADVVERPFAGLAGDAVKVDDHQLPARLQGVVDRLERPEGKLEVVVG